MNTLENLRKDLDQVKLAIGEARAAGSGNLEDLRRKKVKIEREIEESAAESSYRQIKAKKDAEAKRKEELAEKLEDFLVQTVAFKAAFHSVSTPLKTLEKITQELTDAVNGFIDSQNPLMLLGSIWGNLEPAQQATAEEALNAMDFRGEVPRNLDGLVESFDKLTSFISSMGFQAMRFQTPFVAQAPAEKEPLPIKRTSLKKREWVPTATGHKGPRKPPADPYPDRDRNKKQKPIGEQPILPMG